jgi:hypothetical protein
MELAVIQRSALQAAVHRRVLGIVPTPAAMTVGAVLAGLRAASETGCLTVNQTASATTEAGVVRIYLDRGHIYFAEADGDRDLGTRLLNDGVVTQAQLRAGTQALAGHLFLGLLFSRAVGVDATACMAAVSRYSDSQVDTVRGLCGHNTEFVQGQHHPSGVVLWDSQVRSHTEDSATDWRQTWTQTIDELGEASLFALKATILGALAADAVDEATRYLEASSSVSVG